MNRTPYLFERKANKYKSNLSKKMWVAERSLQIVNLGLKLGDGINYRLTHAELVLAFGG